MDNECGLVKRKNKTIFLPSRFICHPIQAEHKFRQHFVIFCLQVSPVFLLIESSLSRYLFVLQVQPFRQTDFISLIWRHLLLFNYMNLLL